MVTVTSTALTVTMDIPVARSYLVHTGDVVAVTMPSGAIRPGHVTSVSSVATDQPSGGASGSGAPSGSGPGGPQQPQVTASVSLTGRPAPADAALDQAPVKVTVTDREAHAVLAVSVTALVALADGGFGVWVDEPGPRHLVLVTPGLLAMSLVQVSGEDLAEGDKVEVPSS
jgi:hypothetical protein